MRFSTLKEQNIPKDTISVFGGYNHNIVIGDNEFYDMKNMSSTLYPVLSPRDKRSTYLNTTKANGLLAKDKLCYVDGTDLYVGDDRVEGLTLSDTEKQMISMGAYIIIMPDKVYVNTNDLTDYGKIDQSFTTNTMVTYSMCNVDGEDYHITHTTDDPPENPANMDYWIDKSTTPHTLMQYSEVSLMWVSIATSYVKIASKDIAKGFSSMDAVKISGIDSSLTQLASLNDQTSIIWDIHRDEEGNGARDYIVVIGMLDEVSTQTTPITVAREMPITDFITESGNRLWGCRYGVNNKGVLVNEIYATKLGDFKNWNYFAGTAADSYVASIGTDGAFTGATSFLGYPMFFKENGLCKVYGNYPANYQIKNTECKGIMKGAGKSLVLCNDYLLYKSRDGICMYDGSLPQEISKALGEVNYNGIDSDNADVLRNGAIAGFAQNKYYISMKSGNEWHLFVYDLLKGMWHKEDNLRVDSFCSYNGELYFIDHDTKRIRTILGTCGDIDEEDVEWMTESNVLGTTQKQSRYTVASVGKKYIGKILVRMSMDMGAAVDFSIRYDSEGDWVNVAHLEGTTLRSFLVPIRPKRCDHFHLRIEGRGKAIIHSVTKVIEQGSDY